MNQGISRTAIVFLVLMLLFFISQINLSLLSGPNAAPSSRSPGVVVSWMSAHNRSAISPILSELTGPITCNVSHREYDLCSINVPTLFDPSASTFFTIDPTDMAAPDFAVKISPYPRKADKAAMSRVKELTLTSTSPPQSTCGVTHTSPALVFSVGGYTGNFFHQFNEGLIPLYLTTDSFFPDRDVVLLISDWHEWWVQKYADLLTNFTAHPIINLDNQTTTHCFPSAIVGLIKHGSLVVDPGLLPNPRTLLDFHAWLNNAIGDHNPGSVLKSNKPSDKPRLVLVNRRGGVGREILNLRKVVKASEESGFEVIVFEPKRNGSLVDTYRLLQSSHAMLAVHGAAMAHLLLLRPGTVLGEIVPIGTDWLAKTFYEKPAKALGLEYIKYKISFEESSLADKYRSNDLVIKDPGSFTGGNWTKARVYMKTQNVRIDIPRFRRVFLNEAFQRAKTLLGKES